MSTDPSPINLLIAEEFEAQAAYYDLMATGGYPETVWPPPQVGVTSTPDCYSAAGYRNAYRTVAVDLRRRAAELRSAESA